MTERVLTRRETNADVSAIAEVTVAAFIPQGIVEFHVAFKADGQSVSQRIHGV